MQVYYLEIVTAAVETTCQTLAAQHETVFSAAQPGLGQARVAELAGGGRIGVRAPLSPEEAPVVRPYLAVSDLTAAIARAEGEGAEFALRETEIPGEGRFAIYRLGGIEHGLWER